MKRLFVTLVVILSLGYVAATLAPSVAEPRLVFRPGIRVVEPPS
jgi:hypothetical protein